MFPFSAFEELDKTINNVIPKEVKVEVREVMKNMKIKDRKSPGQDRISNWIIRQYSEQLADKIQCTIRIGRRPLVIGK